MTPSPRMPTQVGDVLVLRTNINSLTVHAVGLVSKDGQQDFSGHMNVTYVKDGAAAMVEATALVQPGRRIVMWNLDTGEWSDLHGGMTRPSDLPSCDGAKMSTPSANSDNRKIPDRKADITPEPRRERAS